MVTAPGETPNTIPLLLIVAIPTLLVLQVPPIALSVYKAEEPIHTTDGPTIVPALGIGCTVMVMVAIVEQLPDERK
jgi:hypothetical protein